MQQHTIHTILKWIFIGTISLAWLYIFWQVTYDGSFVWSKITKDTGTLAWRLLLFTIFVSLLQKICRIHLPRLSLFTVLLPLRKYAGIFAFLIIVSHAAAAFIERGVVTHFSQLIYTAFSTQSAMIFGSLSFLVMLPLFLTSTTWAVRTMGPVAWKNLQRFTHLAFILAALHVALIYYFNGSAHVEPMPLVLLALYVLGYLYLFLRRTKQQ